jgi:hypothetical protein
MWSESARPVALAGAAFTGHQPFCMECLGIHFSSIAHQESIPVPSHPFRKKSRADNFVVMV